MNKCRLIIVFILFFISSKAEQSPPILKKLATTNKGVITFSHFEEAFYNFQDLPTNYYNQPQQIIKTPKGLYLCQPGSGRVYELKFEEDSIKLSRIDKTFFSGYNFQSLYFNIDTNIYSYGGYGFWHINGDLRVFMPKIGEWEMLETNRYIPRTFIPDKQNNFFFLDTASQSLYISGPENNDKFFKNEYVDLNKLSGKLFKLNIKNGNWEELGSIKDKWFKYRAITSKGILAEDENGFCILDPIGNKIYSFKGQTSEKLMHTPTSTDFQDIRLSYCIGDTLFVGNMDYWIDSIYLNPNDIVDSGNSLYSTDTVTLNTKTISAIGFGLLAIISMIYYRRRIKFNIENGSKNINNPVVLQSSLQTDLLDEREKELLAFVLSQSKNGRLTSILEINDLLGINKRSLDVQKRIRTDTIGPINQKCKFLTNNTEPILSRSRSELDKRMFEYFITPDRFSDAETILGKESNKEF